MEIARGIHKFDTGPFNWYVLEEAGRITVVDAGFPGHFRIFEAGLSSLGLGLKDVEAIVLTHAHADHTGFAARLRKLSGAPIYIHTADARMAERPLVLPWFGLLSNAWRTYTAGMLLHATLQGAFTLPHVAGALPLHDGQALEVPGRPRVLHVPGHTPGQIALLLEDRGVLLASDTLVTRNLLTGKATGPEVPAEVLNKDTRQALGSLDRLSGLGRLTLLPGHGAAWTGELTEAVANARTAAHYLEERAATSIA